MATNAEKSEIERHSANALIELTKTNLQPSPTNYHVFFEHFSKSNVAMSRILNIYLSNKNQFDPAKVQELFETYVAPKFKDITTASADELDHMISRTMAAIEETASNANELAGGAEGVARELGKPGIGGRDIAAALEKLGNVARTAVARAQAAEGELQSTLAETQSIKERFEAASKAALTDGLTEIPNRKNFDQTLRRLAAAAIELGTPLAAAMIDIDHFKKFNDTHGHQLGDSVIKLVARQLADQSRDEDFAARYGGEEFVLLLTNTTGQIANTVVDRIRQSVADKVIKKRDTGEVIGSITISCGVAAFIFGEPLEAFVERADAALYKAKQNGRNRVVLAQ